MSTVRSDGGMLMAECDRRNAALAGRRARAVGIDRNCCPYVDADLIMCWHAGWCEEDGNHLEEQRRRAATVQTVQTVDAPIASAPTQEPRPKERGIPLYFGGTTDT